MSDPEQNDRPEFSQAMIARRAFEISLTDDTGTPEEDWTRAERELRAELIASKVTRRTRLH